MEIRADLKIPIADVGRREERRVRLNTDFDWCVSSVAL